jgi:hypothetical protein
MARGFPIEQKDTDLIVDSPLRQGGRDWFSIAPVVIAWAGMLIFTFYACTRMVAAGDTWVAMACGRHFVNHGVDTVEPFSANSQAGLTAEEVQTWRLWPMDHEDGRPRHCSLLASDRLSTRTG